jgi:hypothetical protein
MPLLFTLEICFLISMSFDPEYKDWVEKFSKKNEKMGGSDQIYKVYRGVPIFQVKLDDDPPRYRYQSPMERSAKYDRLCEKIDKRLDPPVSKPSRKKARGSSKDTEDRVDYYARWQNCQEALYEMEKREEATLAKVEEFEFKFKEMQKEVVDLRAVAVDLRKQLADARKQLEKK